MNKYEVLGVVGEGAYGVVLRCRHKDSGDIVAIKKFKEAEDDEALKKTTLREVRLLRILRHGNIVSLLEAFRRKTRLYLVFEYVEKNLLEVLETQAQGLDAELVRVYILQLVRAIHWCHSHEVVHRDIKPENLLINTRSNTLKLCDFGFARVLSSAQPQELTDYVATRWYRAPELLLGSTSYGFGVDLWAIGCIMGEISDGQPLFPGESEVDQLYIVQKIIGPLTAEHLELFMANPRFAGLKFPDMSKPETLQKKYMGKLSKRALNFMKILLSMDPSDRSTSASCLTDPYFESLEIILEPVKSVIGLAQGSVHGQESSQASVSPRSVANNSGHWPQVGQKNVAPIPAKMEQNQVQKSSHMLPSLEPHRGAGGGFAAMSQSQISSSPYKFDANDHMGSMVIPTHSHAMYDNADNSHKKNGMIIDNEQDILNGQNSDGQGKNLKTELDKEVERERERQREKEIRAFKEFSTKLPIKQKRRSREIAEAPTDQENNRNSVHKNDNNLNFDISNHLNHFNHSNLSNHSSKLLSTQNDHYDESHDHNNVGRQKNIMKAMQAIPPLEVLHGNISSNYNQGITMPIGGRHNKVAVGGRAPLHITTSNSNSSSNTLNQGINPAILYGNVAAVQAQGNEWDRHLGPLYQGEQHFGISSLGHQQGGHMPYYTGFNVPTESAQNSMQAQVGPGYNQHNLANSYGTVLANNLSRGGMMQMMGGAAGNRVGSIAQPSHPLDQHVLSSLSGQPLSQLPIYGGGPSMLQGNNHNVYSNHNQSQHGVGKGHNPHIHGNNYGQSHNNGKIKSKYSK